MIAHTELLLLNDFSYFSSTIIKTGSVFLLAHLILKLYMLLANNIPEFREVKIILIPFST